MSARFLHDRFTVTIPCGQCPGEVDVKAEGHFYMESFVVEGVTNLHTGIELKMNDEQRKAIEAKGDERYTQVQAEAREFAFACAREIQDKI